MNERKSIGVDAREKIPPFISLKIVRQRIGPAYETIRYRVEERQRDIPEELIRNGLSWSWRFIGEGLNRFKNKCSGSGK
ncbi:MAG: hypothetical protein M0Z25_01025 [Nitrospiraceae bacterium]|nr:hypothetical protein [Nitrospiraceae bacterium]